MRRPLGGQDPVIGLDGLDSCSGFGFLDAEIRLKRDPLRLVALLLFDIGGVLILEASYC